MISSTEKFYPRSRSEWRDWLQTHHSTSKGIWLIYFKKGTGRPTISYDESVEEALCFGWIDSTARTLDDERYMQWFTARKPKSVWSKPNKDRIRKLKKLGLMKKPGLQAIEIAKKNGSWETLDKVSVPIDKLKIPDDLEKAFKRQKKAYENFQSFPPFAKRQFIFWIESAKRKETRNARILQTVLMSKANKKPGPSGFKL